MILNSSDQLIRHNPIAENKGIVQTSKSCYPIMIAKIF
jgi:hypothetical protein